MRADIPTIPIKSRDRDVLPSKGRKEITVHVEHVAGKKTLSWKGEIRTVTDKRNLERYTPKRPDIKETLRTYFKKKEQWSHKDGLRSKQEWTNETKL